MVRLERSPRGKPQDSSWTDAQQLVARSGQEPHKIEAAYAGLLMQNAPQAVRLARVSYGGMSRDGCGSPQRVASHVLKVSSYAIQSRSLDAD